MTTPAAFEELDRILVAAYDFVVAEMKAGTPTQAMIEAQWRICEAQWELWRGFIAANANNPAMAEKVERMRRDLRTESERLAASRCACPDSGTAS